MVNLHLISLAKTLDAIVQAVPAVTNTVLVMGITVEVVEVEQMGATGATLSLVVLEVEITRGSLL
jgi:hypothetical protein